MIRLRIGNVHPDTLPYCVSSQAWGYVVEDDEVDVVVPQNVDQLGGELDPFPGSLFAGREGSAVQQHGDVDVAFGMRLSPGRGVSVSVVCLEVIITGFPT